MATSKRGGPKEIRDCEVCGDKAKSLHFGGISCDSCKAFFRRSVQNDVYLSFKCTRSSNIGCKITISTRKICQFCRFQKCEAIGMEKSWVMSEEERNKMYRQRLQRIEAAEGSSPLEETRCSLTPPPPKIMKYEEKDEEKVENPFNLTGQPNLNSILEIMSLQEKHKIEEIISFYYEGCSKFLYNVPENPEERTSVEVIQMFTTILQRFIYFANQLCEFKTLEKIDKIALLRNSILEMVFLRSAVKFDTDNNRWPKDTIFPSFCPIVKPEDIKKLVSAELFNLHMNFIKKIKELNVDEQCIMILLVIVLFSDKYGIIDVASVSAAQDKYLSLLEKYIKWKYPPENNIFPKLLSRLSDVRELHDSHNHFSLKLSDNDMTELKNALGILNLSPKSKIVKRLGLRGGSPTRDFVRDFPHNKVYPNDPIQQGTLSPQGSQMSSSSLGATQNTQNTFQDFVNQNIPVILDNPEMSIECDYKSRSNYNQQSSGSSRSLHSQLFSSSSSSSEAFEWRQPEITESSSSSGAMQQDQNWTKDEGITEPPTRPTIIHRHTTPKNSNSASSSSSRLNHRDNNN